MSWNESIAIMNRNDVSIEEFILNSTHEVRMTAGLLSPSYVFLTAVGALASVGITGNICVMVVVFKTKSMRTATNCYLVSLAASDSLFFAAALPGEVVYARQETYPYGAMACAFLTFSSYLAINVGTLCIAAFTIERYIGICHPMRARHLCTPHRACCIIACIWAFAFAYNSAWLYFATVINGNCTHRTGRNDLAYKLIYFMDIFVFYLFPLLMYIFLYGRMAIKLRQARLNLFNDSTELRERSECSKTSAENFCQNSLQVLHLKRKSYSCGQQPRHLKGGSILGSIVSDKNKNKNSKQVVVMLALIALSFGVCWLPYRALVLYNAFASRQVFSQSPPHRSYLLFSKLMIYVSCSANPIIYNIASSKFRAHFMTVICACSGEQRANDGELSANKHAIANAANEPLLKHITTTRQKRSSLASPSPKTKRGKYAPRIVIGENCCTPTSDDTPLSARHRPAVLVEEPSEEICNERDQSCCRVERDQS